MHARLQIHDAPNLTKVMSGLLSCSVSYNQPFLCPTNSTEIRAIRNLDTLNDTLWNQRPNVSHFITISVCSLLVSGNTMLRDITWLMETLDTMIYCHRRQPSNEAQQWISRRPADRKYFCNCNCTQHATRIEYNFTEGQPKLKCSISYNSWTYFGSFPCTLQFDFLEHSSPHRS